MSEVATRLRTVCSPPPTQAAPEGHAILNRSTIKQGLGVQLPRLLPHSAERIVFGPRILDAQQREPPQRFGAKKGIGDTMPVEKALEFLSGDTHRCHYSTRPQALPLDFGLSSLNLPPLIELRGRRG